MAFLMEREILLRGAVWHVTVDFGVKQHAQAIGDLIKGLGDLTFTRGRDPAQRQELRYASKLAGELQGKVDYLMQMLPRGKRERRGILNLGGKALKFFFWILNTV